MAFKNKLGYSKLPVNSTLYFSCFKKKDLLMTVIFYINNPTRVSTGSLNLNYYLT